ncbi:hypothetical protein MC885_008190, partial [Smutsia gigantea]
TINKGKKIQLKKWFGYYWGTSFLIVNTVGAGIFVVPKEVLKYSCMNVGLSLGALLSVMSTLCSAEVGITFPCSGAHYYFLKRCFTLFLGPGIAASRALLLTEYSIQPFHPSCSAPKLPKECLALAILWIVGILNCRGVREVTWLQTGSTVLKMAILGFISLTGVALQVKREGGEC